jgi:hypothetical protein
MEDVADLGEGETVMGRDRDRDSRVREGLTSTGVEDGDQRIEAASRADPACLPQAGLAARRAWPEPWATVGRSPRGRGGRRLSGRAVGVGEDGSSS